jgi:hypothetical protein
MWKSMLITLSSVLVLATAACDMTESKESLGDYGFGTAAELGELMKRPDAEQVLDQLHGMVTAVAASLTTAVPGSAWLPSNAESKTHCGEFGSTQGNRYTSQRFQSMVPIPPQLWEAASQAVIVAGAKFGYRKVGFRTENAREGAPSNLEIFSDDGYGGRLWLGTDDYANFYVNTGCFLTAKAKQRARDAAPK